MKKNHIPQVDNRLKAKENSDYKNEKIKLDLGETINAGEN
jgi:hypothetical protein